MEFSEQHTEDFILFLLFFIFGTSSLSLGQGRGDRSGLQ